MNSLTLLSTVWVLVVILNTDSRKTVLFPIFDESYLISKLNLKLVV